MNQEFWLTLSGVMSGIILTLLLIISYLNFKLPKSIQGFIDGTSLELTTILKKINWRDYFEANLRADTGKPVKRPFGTNQHFFDWDQLQFNPVYLSQKPLDLKTPVKTEVVLGPLAKKPIVLNIPIMLGGMSYGSSLSFKAKMALAKGAAFSKTASNSGSGPFLEEERDATENYVLQLARGFWSRSDAILSQVDMLEISLGHGAWGPAPVRISGREVTNGFAQRIGTIPGLDTLLESRLPEVESMSDWKAFIKNLKEASGGVPIAVKIGSTHYLEQELTLLIEGGVDVIVIDGTEGGTHACPAILLDDVGLPTLPTICRATRFFKEHRLHGKVSLVVGGGLVTPGDFLKCLALGANAVIVGTIASLVIAHTQVTKVIPLEPPTGIIFYGAQKAAKYNPDLGAEHLHHFFESCVQEMILTAQAMGKDDLQAINRHNLVALDPIYAEMAGVEYLKISKPSI